MPVDLEPDQITTRWSDHVAGYETVFEPFTLALTTPAFGRLALAPGMRVLDVAAGPGAAALAMARAGCRVTAIDGADSMVSRIAARANEAGLTLDARVMDARALAFADSTFDAALSAFGIVLIPDAAGALAEMRRVVKPNGRVAVVTWTEPQRYELAAELMKACDAIWPDRPRPPMPAQLRFRDRDSFAGLFRDAGLPTPEIETSEAFIEAPSAEWLSHRLSFAPGMDAMLAGLGVRREAVIEAFKQALTARFQSGPVRLGGAAFIGTCTLA